MEQGNEVRKNWVEREGPWGLMEYVYRGVPEDVVFHVYKYSGEGGWYYSMSSAASGKMRSRDGEGVFSTRLEAMVTAEAIAHNPEWLAEWLNEVRGGKLP